MTDVAVAVTVAVKASHFDEVYFPVEQNYWHFRHRCSRLDCADTANARLFHYLLFAAAPACRVQGNTVSYS